MNYFFRGIFLLFIASILASCHPSSSPKISSDQKEEIKNLVRQQRGKVDSLLQTAARYKKEGNRYGQMVAHDELGRHFRKAGDFPEAILHHRLQADEAFAIGDTSEVIRAMNNIGTNYRRMGVLDEASSYHFKALSLYEQFSDKESKQSRKNRVISLNGIGNIYLTLDNREAADSIFRLALQGEHELGSALGQAINYANIGALFEMDGKIDSARYYYEQSLKYNIEAKSQVGISLCHTHFGRLYENQRQWKEALAEYRTAYEAMTDKIDDWHWMEACLAMARIYIEMGGQSHLMNARHYIDKALKTANKLQSWEHLSQAHHLIYRWHVLNKQPQQALNHYIQGQQFADSVANMEQKNRVENLRSQFRESRKQREIDLLQANYEQERQSKRMFLYIFLIIILFAISVVGFLVYILRVKERQRHILQSVEKMRRNFYTNITHEFRTPLTVILGFSHLIEEGKLPEGESLKHMAAMISRQGNHLLNLINQLLDISKIRSEVGTSEWYRGDIVPYVEMLCDSHNVLALKRNIDLQCACSQQEIVMDFAPEYLQKILTNLLSNALKFTDDGGRILVCLSTQEEYLKILVSDSGQGIDKEKLPHIFDPFYQCDQSHSSIGTGIGLSLVKQIVETMNGKIQIKSAPKVGTIFTILLPLSQKVHPTQKWTMPQSEVHVENLAPTEDAKVPYFEHDIVTERPTVLIVEDNMDVSRYIASELSDQYSLLVAHNGKEGLRMALEQIPDMILTDLMMPDMDGYELCQAIRGNELVNHIPIIIITAKTAEEDRIRGIQMGADAFLCKPFNSEELHVQITTLLDSRSLLREKYSVAMTQEGDEAVDLNDSDRQFLQKVIDVVFKMIGNANLSNEEIAFEMCISSRQLNRKIYAITGRSTLSFVTQIRLEKAKRMLHTSPTLSIADIAQQCGFSDAAYFSRVFKKMYHLTPSQERKEK